MQLGRMCARLGIQIIAASSTQAEGRVERIHGMHQDRSVKKLRRKRIRGPKWLMFICGPSTCRNTTDALRGPQLGRQAITVVHR
jgi:hypothetical protein